MGRFYVRANETKGADYTSCRTCPIARMLKRKFPNEDIRVAPWSVFIGNEHYALVGNAGEDTKIQPHIEAGTGFHITILGLKNPAVRPVKQVKLKKFQVAAEWRMFGTIEVEAESLSQAIDKVLNNENDEYPTSAFNAEYMDDSFKVYRNECEELA